MNHKLVITIGREFGSEGHEIGSELAKRLDFAIYDKDLLLLAAKEMGIDVGTVAAADEAVEGRFLSPYLTIQKMSASMGDKLFKAQSEIIHNLAAKGSCILVGRLADYILKDHPNCLKVFIYAPYDKRVNIIARKHHISEDEARKFVKKMDMVRKSYYSYYADAKWNQKEGKDILLNRDTFGVNGCVEILEKMAGVRINSRTS